MWRSYEDIAYSMRTGYYTPPNNDYSYNSYKPENKLSRGVDISILKFGDEVVIYNCDTSATVVHSEPGIVKDGYIQGKYNRYDFKYIDGCYCFVKKK